MNIIHQTSGVDPASKVRGRFH